MLRILLAASLEAGQQSHGNLCVYDGLEACVVEERHFPVALVEALGQLFKVAFFETLHVSLTDQRLTLVRAAIVFY